MIKAPFAPQRGSRMEPPPASPMSPQKPAETEDDVELPGRVNFVGPLVTSEGSEVRNDKEEEQTAEDKSAAEAVIRNRASNRCSHNRRGKERILFLENY